MRDLVTHASSSASQPLPCALIVLDEAFATSTTPGCIPIYASRFARMSFELLRAYSICSSYRVTGLVTNVRRLADCAHTMPWCSVRCRGMRMRPCIGGWLGCAKACGATGAFSNFGVEIGRWWLIGRAHPPLRERREVSARPTPTSRLLYRLRHIFLHSWTAQQLYRTVVRIGVPLPLLLMVNTLLM